MTPSHQEIASLRQLAAEVAEGAAALLLDGLDRVRASVETKSSGTDMVTEMDRASEAFVTEQLLAIRPDDAVVGEEGADQKGTSGIRWVVDPLDGTTNYLYRYPGFNVSIAAEAEVDGRRVVVAGAVVDPLHSTTYSAGLGAGATANGEVLGLDDRTVALSHALVATGFSYEPDRRRRQAEVLTAVLPAIRDIRRQGAAALDLCLVASGRVDAFYEKGLAPWDHGAGGLIAAEAGALVGDLSGGPGGSQFVLAARPELFSALRALLIESGAADA